MYTLKSIARRGSMLGAAFAVVAATVIPSIPAYADALNPLTERSLTLSSSSPGWSYTDGSGNSTYAPPNSGANGQKSGNYFDFKVSSSDTVKSMSFQYCTTSAGNCAIPGNDTTPGTDTATSADLNANFTATVPTDLEVANSDFTTVINNATADGTVKAVPGYTNNNPKYQAGGGTGDAAEAAKNVAGNYIVMYQTGPTTWAQSTGWKIAAHNVENPDTGSGQVSRPTKNFITLSNASGQAFTPGQRVKVLFFATTNHYITNPGAGAFFVKINTYNKEYTDSGSPTATQTGLSGLAPASDANIIDGGVTVANVMNQSIQITTKVLETMEFSVGTVDPDTLSSTELAASDHASSTHIPCGRILTRMTSGASVPRNVLQLGNQGAESSLETAKAYATHSYWRLSSNSSGGATVYYSGHTLSNTSGDEIKPIGTQAKNSSPGSEQFGLAIATTALSGTAAGSGAAAPHFNTGLYGVNYAQDRQSGKVWENAADNDKTTVSVDTLKDLQASYTGSATSWAASDADWNYTNLNKSYHTPRLDPLVPKDHYGGGSGKINGTDSSSTLGTNNEINSSVTDQNAAFAFDPLSDTVPVAIASEPDQVVDCVTAKMRYVANIAATTPAGIYTTKINYIAAPQY